MKIYSIDKHFPNYTNQRIALLVDSLEQDKSYEHFKKDDPENWYTLRNRADAFLTRARDRGAKIEVFKNIPSCFDDFTAIVCAGETVYRNVNQAIKVRTITNKPICIEFCEIEWSGVSERVLRKTITMRNADWAYRALCYLTSVPKDPKEITI